MTHQEIVDRLKDAHTQVRAVRNLINSHRIVIQESLNDLEDAARKEEERLSYSGDIKTFHAATEAETTFEKAMKKLSQALDLLS